MNDRDLQQKRIVAAVIDMAIAVVLMGIAWGVIEALAIVLGQVTGSRGLSSVVSLLWWLIPLGYILARDVLAGDRSLGKRLQNVRVVTTTGAPITVMESARRNAIFAIGFGLGLLTSVVAIIPCVGTILHCILILPWVLGGVLSLGAVLFELIKITQDPEGIRMGDRMAGTRVVRG